jgi:hypothetical protein
MASLDMRQNRLWLALGKRLPFPRAVLRALDFVEKSYGFSTVSISPRHVEYRKGRVGISVSWRLLGPHLVYLQFWDYEPATIYHSQEFAFTLEDLVSVEDEDCGSSMAYELDAADLEMTRQVLCTITEALSRYGKRLLEADISLFSDVSVVREARTKVYSRRLAEGVLSHHLSRSELARYQAMDNVEFDREYRLWSGSDPPPQG